MNAIQLITNRKQTMRMTALSLLAAFTLSACVVNQPMSNQAPAANQAAVAAAEPTSLLNVNTASEAELLTIPGVGEKMVDEILEYRPFTNLDHFRKEIGKYVDADQLTTYEKYIVINGN